MRENLGRWVADADTQHTIEDFRLPAHLGQLSYLENRSTDLYYSLVGELFDLVRTEPDDQQEWAELGRALDAVSRDIADDLRVDALFFSAASFYCGGYPASAVVTMRKILPRQWPDPVQQACYELLTRHVTASMTSVSELVEATRTGDLDVIEGAVAAAENDARLALNTGPEEWVSCRLFASLLQRFQNTNLRAVLPDGELPRWTPLVNSFIGRTPPVWDFFPSQIQAIERGLLTSEESYSLQMPTGAGKTALTETLLFSHLENSPESRAVLLVPYRALARELRATVGRHLNRMNLRCRAVYGGTVPTVEEGQDLDSVRVIIATPEALTGLSGTHPELLSSISLVVCDEGHLIDSENRGIGLELLLARLRARSPSPRIVFVSAIVPNVEEVNAWLGGTNETVVRSDYRPATAEFAVLRTSGTGKNWNAVLELHEPSSSVPTHSLPEFLRAADFKYLNRSTGRQNSYPHSSKKAPAIAAARRALELGTVAVFAAQKGGTSGIVGLAEELTKQVEAKLPLPLPLDHVTDTERLKEATDYLAHEYGVEWIGTRSLTIGAIVHHGDLPQETREVLEEMVSDKCVPMVLCTSTLAEGVNLPIRTMVLYSIERRTGAESSFVMRQRDVKNLVGRAGRAGSSTRGLVICASPDVWDIVEPVAEGHSGEPVQGALLDLIRRLMSALEGRIELLDNEGLENTPVLFSLVDGIDAMLIELIHEEIGSEEFLQIADSVAASTFAAQKATTDETQLLGSVVRLRANRLLGLRDTGRLKWVQTSSARPRLISAVVDELFGRYSKWESLDSPSDLDFINLLVEWAMEQPGFEEDVKGAYRKTDGIDLSASLAAIIVLWMQGHPFVEIGRQLRINMDLLLRVHNSVVLHAFSGLIEQAVAIIKLHAAEDGLVLSPVVTEFPSSLRFGVSTAAARELLAQGVRHRRAATQLGADEAMSNSPDLLATPWTVARNLLLDSDTWEPRLGSLVYKQSVEDLAVRRMEA